MEVQILVIYERNKWIKFTFSDLDLGLNVLQPILLIDGFVIYWIFQGRATEIVLMKITTTVVIFINTVDQVIRELLLQLYINC